jgi:Arc/MetJ-type ribon-helix-helix transcriptional regulator
MEKEKTKVVSTRVTQRFADLIEKYCRQDAHVNSADLLRDALREKIQHDAPELYKRLFAEAPESAV